MILKKKKKKRKKEKKEREDLPAAEKTDICAFWYKPFGLYFVSSIQVWKTLFSFGGRNLRAQSNSRDSTNDGLKGRFLLVARHAATLGLWPAIPLVGELPFLKGFSLWTNQSEQFYFYWPPGPNLVVTISTTVGPGSRLRALLLINQQNLLPMKMVVYGLLWRNTLK